MAQAGWERLSFWNLNLHRNYQGSSSNADCDWVSLSWGQDSDFLPSSQAMLLVFKLRNLNLLPFFLLHSTALHPFHLPRQHSLPPQASSTGLTTFFPLPFPFPTPFPIFTTPLSYCISSAKTINRNQSFVQIMERIK